MNVPQKQRSQGLAHSLYSSSKIAVEFEDEDGLKELCLELRELEEEVKRSFFTSSSSSRSFRQSIAVKVCAHAPARVCGRGG